MALQVNGPGIPAVSPWRGYQSRYPDYISFGEGGINLGIPTISACTGVVLLKHLSTSRDGAFRCGCRRGSTRVSQQLPLWLLW